MNCFQVTFVILDSEKGFYRFCIISKLHCNVWRPRYEAVGLGFEAVVFEAIVL